MIHFLAPRGQDFGVRRYMESRKGEILERVRILLYEELFERDRFIPGVYVFTALDQLGPAMTALVTGLYEALQDRPGFHCLNDPRRVLLRPALLDELHRRGYNDFRAVRATNGLDDLRYPVFVRHESSHGGAVSPLLASRRELEAELGRHRLLGHRSEELLVIEFEDTSDEAGNFRKYAAFNVDGLVLARALAVGRSWIMNHEATDFTEEVVLEDRAYVFDNPHREELEAIFALSGVEYGRIDYALKEGRIQTWEINTNPTVGAGRGRSKPGLLSPELDLMRDPARHHFRDRFDAAWLRLDDEVITAPGAAPALVPLDSEAVRAAREEVAIARSASSPEERWMRTRRALQPLKPILAPVARLILPFVGRAARR